MARPSTGSEISILNEQAIVSHASREMPNIASVQVTKSTNVHIGPKIVSVNQTVENKELIKGQILGLELVSVKTGKRLRCSVAVFLCWAFLVASGLAFYLVYFALYTPKRRLDIGLKEEWYYRRDDWQAMKCYGEEFLSLPVHNVIIGHTVSRYCRDKYPCVKVMLEIQNENLQRGFDDIVPNFLVGGNGSVFEGRGANVLAAMAKFWNRKSITIMFIGDYRKADTDPAQFAHVNILLQTLVDLRVLDPDYVVYGHCQVTPQTVSPGPKLVKNLKYISHWDSKNSDQCLPG